MVQFIVLVHFVWSHYETGERPALRTKYVHEAFALEHQKVVVLRRVHMYHGRLTICASSTSPGLVAYGSWMTRSRPWIGGMSEGTIS